MIAVALHHASPDLSLPKAAVTCDLVAANHGRYTLDGVMDLDIGRGKSLLVRKTVLPGIAGSYPGMGDPSLKDGQAAFLRTDGDKATFIVFRFFEPETRVATVSLTTMAKAGGGSPTLLAGGVCKLEEQK